MLFLVLAASPAHAVLDVEDRGPVLDAGNFRMRVTNIGVILPLSKPADWVAGTNILNSARLWADWVNGTGGVGGQHVAIKAYDSHAEPNRAVGSLVRAVTKDAQ